MNPFVFFPMGVTQACQAAAARLAQTGFHLLDHPAPEVTHLLLDVPSFQKNGLMRGGGELSAVLQMLPPQITVVGGNLNHPDLEHYKKWDLLQEERYLAKNAAITADCALKVAANAVSSTLTDTAVLVIGWGRIGKCLAQKLRALGAAPYVTARNSKDLAMLDALGYASIPIARIPDILPQLQLIFNTVPAPVLDSDTLKNCHHCCKIELASQPGLEGADVLQALGLPGIHAPETSGRLIADTIIHSLSL